MIWTICGAGRAIGKTTIAQSITNLMDNSVYCKCGHNEPKPHKPANFFKTTEALNEFIESARPEYDHIVIESNKYVYLKNSDITIFIDGIEGVTDFRRDALRLKTASDIVVSKGSNMRKWQSFLSGKLDDNKLKAVCRLLTAQQRWLQRGEKKQPDDTP